MRVCFDGLCFASKRPAVEEDTQIIQCDPSHHTLDGHINNIDTFNTTTTLTKNNNFELKNSIIGKNKLNNLNSITNLLKMDSNQTIMDIQNNQMNNNMQSSDLSNNNLLNSCIGTNDMNLDVNITQLDNQQIDMFGNLCIRDSNTNNLTNLTPKEQELVKMILEREQKIKELEDNLKKKNEEVAELKSHLDKFQSVFPFSRNGGGGGRKTGATVPGGQQRQRAQGISAEPQNENTVREMLKVSFPKFDKAER